MNQLYQCLWDRGSIITTPCVGKQSWLRRRRGERGRPCQASTTVDKRNYLCYYYDSLHENVVVSSMNTV